MTAGSQSHLNAIREFLLKAFNGDELDELFFFADNPKLKKAGNAYAPQDGLPAKVQKALAYCERHELLGELRAEIERARPGRFQAAAAVVLALPADLADFTGRESEIKRVLKQLKQQGAVTISSIHGMGGSGKTALAVHVAHRLISEGRFKDARLTIDLKGTDPVPVDPVDALTSLLNAVAGSDPGRPRDVGALAALWREAIEGKDAVLILDNAADAAQVRPLLPGCASCAVLVTSRRRFPLAGATRLDLDPMPKGEARTLLQELAPGLEDAQADEIAELCGRLPLALRVAGNYLGLNDDCPPERYAGMLAEETPLARLRDPDDPNLDVAAAISLSVAQLDEGLRRAWALLALFPAPFDQPAAAALWDEADEGLVLERLQALRNRSLAGYDRETERYTQHDLVRLAAGAQLEGPSPQPLSPLPARAGGRLGEGVRGEIDAARLRLARHYEGVARAADRLYLQGGVGVLEGLALFDREWPHIQAGQAWAAAHVDGDGEAARLCSAYPDAGAYLLSLRLHAREHIGWLEAAARAARRLGNRSLEGVHLGYLGAIHMNLGKMEKAIDYYQQALAISREIGDRRNEGAHLNNLGLAYAALGQVEEAIEQYTAALAIAREIGDRRNEGNQLGNLGLAYADLGQVEEAIEQYEKALAIAREIGDRRNEGVWLGNLGAAYYRLGQVEKAIEQYEKALAIAREIGDRRSEGNQLANLGLIYRDRGDTARAREHWTEALAIFEEIKDPNAERVRGWLAGLE